MARQLRLSAALALLLAAPTAAQTVTGRVLGGPSDRVRVELTSLTPDFRQVVRRLQGEPEKPLATARPRPDGSFQIAAPEPGFYAVTVHAEGFEPLRSEIRPLTEETELPLFELVPASPALERAAEAAQPMDLEVRDAQGRPAAGALVWLFPERVPLGVTGPEGRLTLSIPAGATFLLAETEDGQSTILSATPSRKQPQTVTLIPQAPVSGRVVDAASGAPVPGALVWSDEMRSLRPARTAADGSFRFQVPEVPTPLRGAAPGYAPEQTSFPSAPESGAPEPFTLRLTRAGLLSGQVVDAGGRPVASARVQAKRRDRESPSESPDAETESGAEGGFRFRSLRAGQTYEISADKEGFFPVSKAGEAAAPGSPSQRVRLVLTQGGTAFGRVVDERGEPVAGAEVEAHLVDDLAQMRRKVLAKTKDDGSFELRPLVTGSFTLQAYGPGFAPAYVAGVEIPAAAARVDLGTITLAPEAVIEGQVTDSRGEPVAGAEIEMWPNDPVTAIGVLEIHRQMRSRASQTDPDGRFRLDGLSPGRRVRITAAANGYAVETVEGVEVPPPAPLRIELRRLSELSGRVLDPEGEPVAGAFLFVASEQPGRSGSRQAETDSQGRFQIDFEPGPVMLLVQAQGYREGAWRGEVPEEREGGSPVEIRLDRGATLEGRVTDAGGHPVGGAIVFLYLKEEETGTFSEGGRAWSNGEGFYRMSGLETGVYEVQVSDGKDEAAASVHFQVRPGANRLDLPLKAGVEVAGHVRDGAGLPVAEAEVSLFPVEPTGRYSQTISSADGSFHLSHVPDGAYQVTASKRGAAPARQDVEVAGRPLQGLDLRLTPGTTITGRLLGVTAAELAGVRILVQGVRLSAPPTIQRDGTYRISDVPPGESIVIATLDSGRSAQGSFQVEPGMTEAVLDLDLGGQFSLSGVLRLDGTPLPLARLTLSSSQGQGAGNEVSTGSGGRFRMTHLEPGPYRLSVQVERMYLDMAVELRLDQEVVLELTTGRVQGQVLSPPGTPVTNAHISLAGTYGEWSVQSVTRTDGQGRFELRVPAGEYRLTVNAQGLETQLQVPAGDTVQVRIPVPGRCLWLALSLPRDTRRPNVCVSFVLFKACRKIEHEPALRHAWSSSCSGRKSARRQCRR